MPCFARSKVGLIVLLVVAAIATVLPGKPAFSLGREGWTQLLLQIDQEKPIEDRRDILLRAKDVFHFRLTEFGVTAPLIRIVGDDRILVKVERIDNSGRIKHILTSTANMTFHLQCPDGTVSQARQGRAPIGCEIFEPMDPNDFAMLLERQARLSSEDIKDAKAGFDTPTGQPIISFAFNSKGGAIFAELTAANVGRQFAVVLDDRIIMAPVIQTPILQGMGQISGGFSAEAAVDLAVMLRSGPLPAVFNIIEERTVGPDLNQDFN